jgi:hypothetical protein
LSSVTKTILNALGAETSRRRFVAQLGIGSAVLLLSACGGGGGSGLVEDDSSSNDNTARLRRAYDELQPGMTAEDVLNVVGLTPDPQPNPLTWRAPGGTLSVALYRRSTNGVLLADVASWISSGENLNKSLVREV